MAHARLAVTIVAVTAAAFAQPAGSARARKSSPPLNPWETEGSAIVTIEKASSPNSLNDLVAEADVIVAGRVRASLPARSRDFKNPTSNLETDAEVAVDTVLKGRLENRTILVAETGGTMGRFRTIRATDQGGEDPLLQAGKGYLLFLNRDARPGLPNEKKLPRYTVASVMDGKMLLERGKVVPSPGATAAIRAYQGTPVTKVAAEIGRILTGRP